MTRTPYLLGAVALAHLGLVGCAPNGALPVSASGLQAAAADVQLFCAIGQTTAAVAVATGSSAAPVLAKGASSAYVQAVCAAAGGFAVVPPKNPGDAPLVVVPSFAVRLVAGVREELAGRRV